MTEAAQPVVGEKKMFFCTVHRLSLTPEGCAKMYNKAAEVAATGKSLFSAERIKTKVCEGCEVGELHAQGKLATQWANRRELVYRSVDTKPYAANAPDQKKPKTALRILPDPPASIAAPPPPPKQAPKQASKPKPAPVAPPVVAVAPPPAPEPLPEPEKPAAPLLPPVANASRRGGRPAMLFTMNGVTLTAQQWCATPEGRALELTPELLRERRRRRRMSDVEALTQPRNYNNPKQTLEFTGLSVEVAERINLWIKARNLSVRETDVLVGMIKDIPNFELAEQLNISESTIRSMLGRMARKLGVTMSSEMVPTVLSKLPEDNKMKTETSPKSSAPAPTKKIELAVKDDLDEELAAITAIVKAMNTLQPATQLRVLNYTNSRYGRVV